jgi:uncharacterized Zn finger protein
MEKPQCKLIGQDGNVFNLIGLATKALKRAGQYDQARKMSAECFRAGSYDEVLQILQNYVEVE